MMCETCSDPEKHALEAEVERLRALVANYEFHFKVGESKRLRKQADENGYMVLARDRELERLREEKEEAKVIYADLLRAAEMANEDLGKCAARLHRIEEAVRAYVEKNSGYGHGSGLDPLRAALEKEA